MDMCVCENQNKTENSETEKSSNNNPLPQIQQTHKLYPLSLMYYCWKSVTMFGCDVEEIAHVSARTIYQNQLQKKNKKQKMQMQTIQCY